MQCFSSFCDLYFDFGCFFIQGSLKNSKILNFRIWELQAEVLRFKWFQMKMLSTIISCKSLHITQLWYEVCLHPTLFENV
jgi:hypothetical protein